MKNILCFGDSNTWGTSPKRGRYGELERWTGILSQTLSDDYHVIEAGEPNRTLVNGSPFNGNEAGKKSGQKYLQSYLAKSSVALVIIMLGTNDLKRRFELSVTQVASGLGTLVEQVWQFTEQSYQKKCNVLVVAPAPIYEVGTYNTIYQGGSLKSQQLGKELLRKSTQLGCHFFDASTVVKACQQEGVHWPVSQHKLFAHAIANKVSDIFACQ